MSPDRAAKLLAGICRGLGYAHENQLIHGDLRAAHLIVDEGDQVKVTNFGLGRMMLAEADVRPPGVVAPELLDPDLDVDHRSDIFALGVLFYEMLVGERPAGSVRAGIRRHRCRLPASRTGKAIPELHRSPQGA